ncbi:protein TIC 20-I, chloroplastic-like [Physcomitrium patens]|uniref:Protein TIC 20 n=1 Tax=Physcomitrium patens TaxID=3218 RepID=A0A2K1IA85_PHYPA|nr:hypothetical protein PHYPA_030761 [Physcomitrium patens]
MASFAVMQTSSLSQVLSYSKMATRSIAFSSSASSASSSSSTHLTPLGCGFAICNSGLPAGARGMTLSHNKQVFAPLGSMSSCFLEGESGRIWGSSTVSEITLRRRRCNVTPRAATEDVPSFKGFAPMQEKPKFWWRILACVPYLMPLSETWMYAETAYSLHSFIEDYEFCTYPFLILIGSLPSWFLLAYFFGAYLGIVRNNRWPHFLRFHVVTGMLLEIIVQVIGTVNDWVPQAVYWGKFGAHYWLAVTFAFLFIVLDCIRCALNGMYADVPFLSDASYMQIPYE